VGRVRSGWRVDKKNIKWLHISVRGSILKLVFVNPNAAVHFCAFESSFVDVHLTQPRGYCLQMAVCPAVSHLPPLTSLPILHWNNPALQPHSTPMCSTITSPKLMNLLSTFLKVLISVSLFPMALPRKCTMPLMAEKWCCGCPNKAIVGTDLFPTAVLTLSLGSPLPLTITLWVPSTPSLT